VFSKGSSGNKVSDLFFEHLDAEIDDSVFFVSSFSFGSVEFSLFVEVSLGGVDGVDGVGPDGFGFSLGSEGGRLLNKELVEVLLFSVDFVVEEGLFSTRVTLPFGEGPGGSDFGGLEESEGFVELVLDGSEDFIDLLSDGIGFLLGGGELKEGLLGLFVEESAVVRESIGDVVHVDLGE